MIMNTIKKPIDLVLDKALKFRSDKNFLDELECYKEILSSYSKNYNLLNKLLKFLATVDRWEIALETISAMKKIDCPSELTTIEVFVHTKLHNFRLAIDLLKTLLGKDDSSPILYNNLVSYYNISLCIDEGIEYFNEELKNDKTNPDIYFSLAFLYYYKTISSTSLKFTPVLEYSKLGEKYRSNDTYNLNVLGMTYYAMKLLDKSEYYFLESIKADPTNSIPHSNLGVLYSYNLTPQGSVLDKAEYESTKRLDSTVMKKAIHHLNTALSLNPSLTGTISLVGDIFLGNKLYDKAINLYKKNSNWASLEGLLKCYYYTEDYDNFHSILNELSARDSFKESRNVSALLSHANINLGLDIDNFYCPNPLAFVHYFDSPSPDGCLNFNSRIIDECNSLELGIRNQGLLSNGQQSTISLFDQDSKLLLKLKNYIISAAADYKRIYKDHDVEFIKNWPKDFQISAWIVTMDKGGALSPHNHPNGWLSGVYYLSVPEKVNKHDANIKFSLIHPDYPHSDAKFPDLEINTKDSRLVLFPSSLYHQTIPFYDSNKRICIAFDFQPV